MLDAGLGIEGLKGFGSGSCSLPFMLRDPKGGGYFSVT